MAERLTILVDAPEQITVDALHPALSTFLKDGPADSKVEVLDRSKYLSGNSASMAKLTVEGRGAYHVKLVTAPDPESMELCVTVRKYPALVADDSVLLPLIVDVVVRGETEPLYHLHITKWVENTGTLAENVITLWFQKKYQDLQVLLYSFGRFLRAFHLRYPGLQHTDMNPSNVLLVPGEKGGLSFVLADCGGLDGDVGDDRTSFLLSLGVLADGGFGTEFLQLATASFEQGYGIV